MTSSASTCSALTSDDLARIEHRARRAGQPTWTGTAGTLAADVMRLLAERQRLLAELARVTEPGGRS